MFSGETTGHRTKLTHLLCRYNLPAAKFSTLQFRNVNIAQLDYAKTNYITPTKKPHHTIAVKTKAFC